MLLNHVAYPVPRVKSAHMQTNRMRRQPWVVVAIGIALAAGAAAQQRDRARIPDQYRWSLADIYPNAGAWRAAKDKLAAEIPQLKQFEGKLASSAATLADELDKQYALDKELSRIYTYAPALR